VVSFMGNPLLGTPILRLNSNCGRLVTLPDFCLRQFWDRIHFFRISKLRMNGSAGSTTQPVVYYLHPSLP
jgi:hypothetical protein